MGEHDHDWWEYWKGHVNGTLGHPVQGEARFSIFSITRVDVDNQVFDARVLVDVRIRNEQFQGLPIQPKKGQKYAGFPNPKNPSEWLSEWHPKIIFVNLVDTKLFSQWVRKRSDYESFPGVEFNVYSFEVIGTFSTNLESFWYPMDRNELNVVISTDWDKRFFELRHTPKGNKFLTENCREIRASFYILERVKVLEKESQGSKGLKYSEVHITTFVNRKYIIPLILLLVKPVIITTLGLATFLLPSSDMDSLVSRISFAASLLVSASLSNKSANGSSEATFVDIINIVAYIILVIINFLQAIMIFNYENISDDAIILQRYSSALFTGTVITWAIICGGTLLVIVVRAFYTHMQTLIWDREPTQAIVQDIIPGDTTRIAISRKGSA